MTKAKKALRPSDIVNDKPSMTKQDGAQTPSDVYRSFVQGQPLPEGPPPVYADLSNFDYAEVRNTMAEFESAFEELPSRTREFFGNDTANYAAFLGRESAAIAEQGLAAVISEALDPTPEPEPEVPAEPNPAEAGAPDGGATS